MCAPHGQCSTYSDRQDTPLVKRTSTLCPTDVTIEPRFKTGKVDQGLFSQAFDSHYCLFPTEPFVIDRTANSFGNHDSAGNCERANAQMALGQRSSLLSCLDQEDFNLQQKQCLRYYQSLLCTLACPTYGQSIDQGNLCNEYCEDLHQVCDDQLFNCLNTNQPLPIEGCASAGTTDCSSPPLIRQSGQFEHDLCFYGDCPYVATDCVVTLSSSLDLWSTDFTNPLLPNKYHDAGGAFDLTITGPMCCYFWSDFTDYNSNVALGIGLLYKIVTPAELGGLSCNDAVYNAMVTAYGRFDTDIYNSDSIECGPHYCIGFMDAFSQDNLFLTSPTNPSCNSIPDQTASTCPGAVSNVWD